MLKLKFEAKKPYRLHRYYVWVDVEGHCWNRNTRQWVIDSDPSWTSTSCPCRTIRAFKRMLRKHPHIQGKAILSNRYRNNDVYG